MGNSYSSGTTTEAITKHAVVADFPSQKAKKEEAPNVVMQNPKDITVVFPRLHGRTLDISIETTQKLLDSLLFLKSQAKKHSI